MYYLLSHVWLFTTPWTILPGSPVHGILQARILEWVAIPFSRGSSRPKDQTQVSWIAGRFFTIWATQEIFYLLILNLNVLVVRISVLFIFLSHPVTKLSNINKYILNAFKWYDHNIQKAKENSDYCDGKICKGNVFCSLCIFTLFFLPILLCSEWFIF